MRVVDVGAGRAEALRRGGVIAATMRSGKMLKPGRNIRITAGDVPVSATAKVAEVAEIRVNAVRDPNRMVSVSLGGMDVPPSALGQLAEEEGFSCLAEWVCWLRDKYNIPFTGDRVLWRVVSGEEETPQ